VERILSTNDELLQKQTGKKVKSIQFHEVLGTLEIHLEDGTSVTAHAESKAQATLMIIEPKQG
jgi:hypothetical protein